MSAYSKEEIENLMKNYGSYIISEEKTSEKNYGSYISDISDISHISDISGITSREKSLEETRDTTSARPPGQTASEESALGQKAKGLMSAPRDLAQEIQDLKYRKEWIEQPHIKYLKVDLYFDNPNDISTLGISYNFIDDYRNKTLSENSYKSTLNTSPYRYIEHPRALWHTNNIPLNYYEETYLKQRVHLKTGLYFAAGKSSRKKSWGSRPTSLPLETQCGVVLYQCNQDDWHLEIHHQGAEFKFSEMHSIFKQKQTLWIDQYAIQHEYNTKKKQKNNGIKPFISFTYKRPY